jgi:mRNA-degrading endonuclease RelE of RelBE toxin-antitoxin system
MTSKPAARKAATKYSLKFVPDAWREWQALDGSIKQALKPLLAKRLQNPHVPDSLLHRELAGCYKWGKQGGCPVGINSQNQTAQAGLSPRVYD